MKLLFTTFFYFAALIGFGQNLVPNPSFEEYNQLECVVSQNDFDKMTIGWTSPTTQP
jgi:hypothetical protein